MSENHTTSCNPISFKACELAYNYAEKWLDACIATVDANQHHVINFFAEKHPEIRLIPVKGTYLQWLDFRALGLTHDELDDFLENKAQLFFTDGMFFGEAADGFKRWNLAAPRVEIDEALDRLDRALLKLEGE